MKKLLLLLSLLFLGFSPGNAQKHFHSGLYTSAGNFSLPRKAHDFLLLFPNGSNEFQLKAGFSGSLGAWTEQALGKRFRLQESLGLRYNRYGYVQRIDLPDYQTTRTTTEVHLSAVMPVLLYFSPVRMPKWSIFGGIGLTYTFKEYFNHEISERFYPAQPVETAEHYQLSSNSPLNAFLSAGLQYELASKTWIGLEFTAEESFEPYRFTPAGERYANPIGERMEPELKDDFGINMRSFSVSLRHQLWP